MNMEPMKPDGCEKEYRLRLDKNVLVVIRRMMSLTIASIVIRTWLISQKLMQKLAAFPEGSAKPLLR